MRCPLLFSVGGGDCIESECAWWADKGCAIPQCTAKAMLTEPVRPMPIIIPKAETDKMEIRHDGTDAKGMDDLKSVTTSSEPPNDFEVVDDLPKETSATDAGEILDEFCEKCGRVMCRTVSGDEVCTNVGCGWRKPKPSIQQMPSINTAKILEAGREELRKRGFNDEQIQMIQQGLNEAAQGKTKPFDMSRLAPEEDG